MGRGLDVWQLQENRPAVRSRAAAGPLGGVSHHPDRGFLPATFPTFIFRSKGSQLHGWLPSDMDWHPGPPPPAEGGSARKDGLGFSVLAPGDTASSQPLCCPGQSPASILCTFPASLGSCRPGLGILWPGH